jgi:hypothetical protein
VRIASSPGGRTDNIVGKLAVDNGLSFQSQRSAIGRTIQFMFERDIADDESDSYFLRIIRIDFPCPERNGSFTAMVMGGEVLRWMQDAFKKGADPAQFDGLTFEPW